MEGIFLLMVHREGVTVRFEQPDVATTLNLGDLLPIRAKASVLADMKLFVANEQIVSQNQCSGNNIITHFFADRNF